MATDIITNMPPTTPQNSSFTLQRRLRNARIHAFAIIDKFKYGYRHREDQTNLPAGVLVEGSKNVLTNVSERIQARQGYVLDGPVSSTICPISAAYTFTSHLGFQSNLRAYSPISTTGKLEYRYVNSSGTVTWRTLLSSLTSTSFNFTSWWNVSELERVVLAVNGTTKIYEWNGATAVALSSTATTITKTGAETWEQAGFYVSTNRSITINGTVFTYTGGANTTTLTGLSADPAVAIAADPIVHQTPVTTDSSTFTNFSPGLAVLDLIQSFQGFLILGDLKDQTLWVSKFQDYTDYTESSINKSGFGTTIFLDSPPVAFVALENAFTVSAGLNQWYQTTIATSTYTDTTLPAAPVVYDVDTWTTNRLKTNSNASSQSQALTGAMKNDVIFVSNEPTLDRLGRVEQILGSTQTTNISDPIKLDFDNYNFTDGSIFYNKYFIYIAVPKEGIVRIYNIVKSYWEAPQTIPISRFYTVDGALYGHSYLTPESYQLFTGYADRVDPTTNPLGNPINCKVVFSYNNYGSPPSFKSFNEFYVEGYISSNTTIDLGITYDIDGCATDTSYNILGTASYVCLGTGSGNNEDASLGKNSLGKFPLGGNLTTTSPNALPPKFRVIKTFPMVDFYEVQYSFETSQTGAHWEILRFGPNLNYSSNLPATIND